MERRLQGSIQGNARTDHKRNRFGTYYEIAVQETLLDTLDAAMRDFPDDAYLLLRAANIYFDSCIYDEAKSCLTRIIEMGGDYVETANLVMCMVLKDTGDIKEAGRYLERYNSTVVARGEDFLIKRLSDL